MTKMPRITKITYRTSDQEKAATALAAAVRPFGSLVDGVDTGLVVRGAVEYASSHTSETGGGRPDMAVAAKVLAEVLGAETSQTATVEFGYQSVTFRTPTSGTKIWVHFGSGNWLIEVDFGERGSKHRALDVLAAAEYAWVQFSVYGTEKGVTREMVLEALLDRAEGLRTYAEQRRYGSAEEREIALAEASKGIAFFENLFPDED